MTDIELRSPSIVRRIGLPLLGAVILVAVTVVATVSFTSATADTTQPTDDGPQLGTGPELEQERIYNEWIVGTMTDQLEQIVGKENVVVMSRVDLDVPKQSKTVVLAHRIAVAVDDDVPAETARAAKQSATALAGGGTDNTFAFTQAPFASER